MGCINTQQTTMLDAQIFQDSSLAESETKSQLKLSSFNHNIKEIASSSLKTMEKYFPAVQMLNEINEARSNPMKYIEKIQKIKSKVKQQNNKSYVEISDSQTHLKLNQGIQSFDNCIDYLKKINPLPPLKMKEELKIPFPIQSPHICSTQDYLRNIIIFQTSELNSSMKLLDFHYDICAPNPELSVVLQIVDDTGCNYQRRKSIFHSKAKHVGITHGIINNELSCYYLLFSE